MWKLVEKQESYAMFKYFFNSMQRMPNKCTQNLSASCVGELLSASCFDGEVHLIPLVLEYITSIRFAYSLVGTRARAKMDKGKNGQEVIIS